MANSRKNMGTIRKRQDGRWEGRFSDPSGRQRSVYGKTQKECAQKLKAALAEVDAGSWMQPSAMTVGDWLDAWLETCPGHTTGQTYRTYEFIVRKRLKPVIGRVRLCDFSAIHAQRLFTGMKQLSPSTIHQTKAVLSSALSSAVDAKLVRENVAAGVKIPRVQKRRFAIVDRPQIPAFLRAARETRHPDALIFLLLTGLRCGEMCGLQWADVDLDGGVIHVERQLYAPTAGTREFRPPKDGSARAIAITPEAVALLKAHRLRQLQDRMAAGSGWIDDEFSRDLVFRQPNGLNLHEGIVYRAVCHVRGLMAMPDLRPHDLRHSYAVAALRSGVDVKTVQHNLGHRSAAVTLDVYAEYTSDAGRVGAQLLSAYWQDAMSGE